MMRKISITITNEDLINNIKESEVEEIIRDEIKRKVRDVYKEDIKDFVTNYVCVTFRDKINEIISELGEDFETMLKEEVKKKAINVSQYEIFRHKDSWGGYDSKAVTIMNEVFSDESFKDEFKQAAKKQMFDKIDKLEYDDFMYIFNYGILDLLRDNLTKKEK